METDKIIYLWSLLTIFALFLMPLRQDWDKISREVGLWFKTPNIYLIITLLVMIVFLPLSIWYSLKNIFKK